jgi:hypothetical protein
MNRYLQQKQIYFKFNNSQNKVLLNVYNEYTPTNIINDDNSINTENNRKDYESRNDMTIYFNSFWPDFFDDPKYSKIFIDLFSNVFNSKITIGTKDNSDILIESIFGDSIINYRKWTYSFFFLGEPKKNEPSDLYTRPYTALLMNSRSYNNIIHFPFFVYYLTYASLDFRTNDVNVNNIKVNNVNVNNVNNVNLNNLNQKEIPKKFCCTFITNPNGTIRNSFIEKLEISKKIDHYGKYKNNQGKQFSGNWHSEELVNKMKEYKFVIAFENSEDDAYITEKIINPLRANIIPVYWGNRRINDYFNTDRLLHLNDINKMDELIAQMIDIDKNNEKYLDIINQPIHDILNVEINITTICNDIQRLLFNNNRKISKVVCIVSEEKERDRYNKMVQQLVDNNFDDFITEYLLPTYYDNMDKKLFNKIKINNSKYLISNNREISLREVSIFLNFYIIMKRILGYYRTGIFIIFESDVIFKDNFNLVHTVISNQKLDNFDCISFGNGENQLIPSWVTETTSTNIKLYKVNNTRCMDSMIFSYNGIQKFVNYIESKIFDSSTGLDNPIDYFMNEFLKEASFNMFWTIPSFTDQGSQTGVYESNIQVK